MKPVIRMKKVLFLCFLALCIVLSGCSHVTVKQNASASLRFHYGDASVDTQLFEEEAAQLCDIVNGKALYRDNPACGFDESISFQIDGKVFCPARDSCCIVQEHDSGKYMNISQPERDALERIFENHGGFFPCE